MKHYSLEDLKVIGNPLEVLRKSPSMYVGEAPRGPTLSARVMRDLILLDALPARVTRHDDWWIISADKDWLALDDGSISKRPFFHIVPFTAAGHAAFRSEVLLTAFSHALVTRARGHLEWIVPLQNNVHFEEDVILAPHEKEDGRLIAFKIEEP